MGNVNCPLYENAQNIPQHTALITKSRTWTYAELELQLQAVCNFLENAGVKENQRIAFIAPSSVATILLFFALFRLKAIACPLSIRLPAGIIAEYVRLLKASHVLEPSLLSPDRVQASSHYHSIDLDAPATFLFTSGTTGSPKVACHSFANHYYNALSTLSPLKLDASSRWLLSLPLFHVSGIAILFRCFLAGATVVLSELPLCETLISQNISHLSLVPTQLSRLLKESKESLIKISNTMKCILLGGAPLPIDLLTEARNNQLPVYSTYGMTEMGSMITLSEINAIGHSGKLLPYRELKLEQTEIWVGGTTLFKGYWDPANETIVDISEDGWFFTNDLGQLNTEGQLEVTGRADRQFISGGENIQPEEIEKALCTLPGIRQASVLPISDSEFGYRPIAFIEDETHAHTLESIREGLRDRLPNFKHPVRIFPYPSSTGIKPNLTLLKEHLHRIQESPSKNRE